MRELAIFTAGVLGYVGVIVGIFLFVSSLRQFARSGELVEGFVAAGMFFFLVGSISLIIMFSTGGVR